MIGMKQLEHHDMIISETWRWRLLTIWVVLFSALVIYAIILTRNFADDNRNALCAVHSVHAGERALLTLLPQESANAQVQALVNQINIEEAVLAHLGCPE